MIDATLLFDGSTVYSPWFPRQADMLRVVAECVALNGAALTITLYTKNSDETGDGANVDTAVSITLNTIGRNAPAEWRTISGQEGVQQLLRFRYEIAGGSPNDWILFRLLPAVWFDSVAAGAP